MNTLMQGVVVGLLIHISYLLYTIATAFVQAVKSLEFLCDIVRKQEEGYRK